MTPWIKTDTSLPRNLKTARLARYLAIDRAHAVGIAVCLWTWAIENAESGEIKRDDWPSVAENILWRGESEELLQALLDSGFLDDSGAGKVAIHDWQEWAGALLEKREADRQRAARNRNPEKPSANGSRTLRERSTNSLAQSRVEKSREESKSLGDPDAPTCGDSTSKTTGKPTDADLKREFEESFWPGVPVKVAKGAARTAFAKARRSGVELQTILDGLPGFHAYEADRKRPDPERYRPLHPSNWLNGERWTDEPPEPDPEDKIEFREMDEETKRWALREIEMMRENEAKEAQ
jgi:hypothetical protein